MKNSSRLLRRVLTHAFLVLFLAGSAGCGALGELDKGQEEMARRKGKKLNDEGELVETTAAEKRAQAAEYWDRAESLTQESLDASIGSCRLGGKTQFMRKNDCISRGGTPGGV